MQNNHAARMLIDVKSTPPWVKHRMTDAILKLQMCRRLVGCGAQSSNCNLKVKLVSQACWMLSTEWQ